MPGANPAVATATSTNSGSFPATMPAAVCGTSHGTVDSTVNAIFPPPVFRTNSRPVCAAPPATLAGAARALYTWTVALRTDAGPVPDDATLTVALRMPDHGHGGRRPPTVRPLGGGRYELVGLDLYMEGVWTVTLRVTANGAMDQVVFGVCIG